MTVRYYRWDDTSAPTLNNAAGSLVALLDAVLVNGYGSKAAAGWAIAFTGTNKRVYRAATGVRPYIRFDDSTTVTCQGIRLVEAMTDVDTITSNPTPTVAQASSGLFVYKSANSTNRPWVIAASETAVCLYIGHDNTTAEGLASTTVKATYFFGEFSSYLPGDAFNALVIANTSGSSSPSSAMNGVSTTAAAIQGHYVLRANDQTTLSVNYSKNVDQRALNVSSVGQSGFTYPDPVTGGMLLSPFYLTQPTQILVRGKMPGWWAVLHNLPGNPGDTFTGTGALAGKTFLLLDSNTAASARARIALEISDTWS